MRKWIKFSLRVKTGKFFRTIFGLVAFGGALGVLTPSDTGAAGVILTNHDGLVVKHVSCEVYVPIPSHSEFRFSVVNRTSKGISGTLVIRGIDSDGDPVVSHKASISLDPASGEAIMVNFRCGLGKRFLFSLK